MRRLLILMFCLVPAAQAQDIVLDDPQGDAGPRGLMATYDLARLVIDSEVNGTRMWAVTFHDSPDWSRAATEWEVRLFIRNGSMPDRFVHDSMCLSLPPSCAEGRLEGDLCGRELWVEIVWIAPHGDAMRMDQIPDTAPHGYHCPAEPAPSAPSSSPNVPAQVQTPSPLVMTLVALGLAARR